MPPSSPTADSGAVDDVDDRIRLAGVMVRDRRLTASRFPNGRLLFQRRRFPVSFRFAIVERHPTGRGMFAVTKSDGKHALLACLPMRQPTIAHSW